MSAIRSMPAIRLAAERDLDALAAYEVTIAKVSFGDDAVTDPAVHRKKLAKALDRDRTSMFVATSSDDPADDAAIGWLWLAVNTNFLTGDRYANFRSLAVSDRADRDEVAGALIDHALAFATAEHLTEVVGRCHVDNTGMRMLYRKFGFQPVSLTLRRRLA